MKFLDSICDSIIVPCLLSDASRDVLTHYRALRHTISPSYVVFERKPADGNLDAVPRCEGEVFWRHDACAGHEKGPVRQRELLAEVSGQLLEGAPHPGGAGLALEDDVLAPPDA